MDCNNVFCYWQSFGYCCHESEEDCKDIVPNSISCPSSLRKDFENQLYKLADECVELIKKRNMKELIEIKKFIESQR